MTQAVRDTNVIVSGVIRQAGPPGHLWEAGPEARQFTPATSPSVLEAVQAKRQGQQTHLLPDGTGWA